MNTHFRVAVRCKPSAEEKAWRVDESSLSYAGPGGKEREALDFHYVFTEKDGHEEVYSRAVAPLVEDTLKGANLGVVTYGLPCMGKTHTVFGTSGQARIKQEARGLVVRCGQQLLKAMEAEEKRGTVFKLTASFCHVFENGRVADLFETRKRDLGIVESPVTAFYSVVNLTEMNITSATEVMHLVEKGYLIRNAAGCVKSTGSKNPTFRTVQPLQQYRQHTSHAIFTFRIEQVSNANPRGSSVCISHIIIADLAGEPIKLYHSDAQCSDTGIDTLHSIINRLPTEGISSAVKLFPQSNLTKLLKPCFGGNCRTLLIGNVCLSEASTVATGKCFGVLQKATGIKNYSKPTSVPITGTTLGQLLQEADAHKAQVAEKLQVTAPVEGWEVVSEKAVMVNGRVYEELTPSCCDLVAKIALIEGELVVGGKPAKKATGSGFRPTRGLRLNKSGPLGMLRLNTQQEGSRALLEQSMADTKNKTPTTEPIKLQDRAKEINLKKSARSSTSSLSDESDSDSDGEPPLRTPSSAGPPPPPLKGIPHIKPDPGGATTEQPDLALLPSSPTLSSQLPLPLSPVPQSSIHPASPPRKLAPLTKSPSLVLPRQQHHIAKISVAPVQPKPPAATTTPTQVPPNADQRPPSTQAPSLVPRPSLPSSGAGRAINNSNSSQTVDPVAVTSTPKSKRSLLPQFSQGSESEPPSPVQHAQGNDPRFVKPLKVVSNSASTAEKSNQATTPHDLHQHKEAAALPFPHAPNHPTISQPRVLPPVVTGPFVSPSHTTAFVPRAPLGPIRPVGVALSLRHTSQVSPTRRPPVVPHLADSSNSSSSLSLSNSSDSDDSDEARDTFNPEMQRRQLTIHHVSPHMAFQHQGSAGLGHLPILPPIDYASSHSGLPPPHYTPHTLTPTQPPAYEQASAFAGSQTHPSSHYRQPQTRETDSDQTDGSVDVTQFMSSEEVHMAAMEGAKTSTMKRLANHFGVDYRDPGGRTPLMYAVLGNQPKMCEVLLSLGATVEEQDCSGFTALLWAAYQATPQVMKVLIRGGADLRACDANGRNAFHWAVKTPHIQCLKQLCKHAHSAVVNKPDNEGLTPLHWAVMCDQASHIRILLTSTNADVSAKDREGRTPLNYAVLNFSPSCIKAILDCRESAVGLTDEKGRTALHYACAEGSADCVRTLLLYRCCNLHCTDNRGTTPLHWAAAANQPGLLQLLLRRGADRAQRDRDNMTALDHAEQRGHSECSRILHTYGLRRPSSAISVASHVSIQSAAAPNLDEQGHVLFRRPRRRFSLFSTNSVTSMDRQPADGQAHSEGSPMEQLDADGKDMAEEDGEVSSRGDGDDDSVPLGTRWAYTQQTDQTQQEREQPVRRRRLRAFLGLCNCLGGNNTVVPIDSNSTPSLLHSTCQ